MRGTVISVYDRVEGTYLSADAASAATELDVYDTGFFSIDGGSALVTDGANSDTVTYASFDEDANQVTGVAGLGHSYSGDNTQVVPLPKATTRYAEVQETDEDDTVQVRVPHHLFSLVAPGHRDPNAGETFQVVFTQDEGQADQWVLTDVLGEIPAISGAYVTPGSIPTDSLVAAAQLSSIQASGTAQEVTINHTSTEAVITSCLLPANFLMENMMFRVTIYGRLGTKAAPVGDADWKVRIGPVTLTGSIVSDINPPLRDTMLGGVNYFWQQVVTIDQITDPTAIMTSSQGHFLSRVGLDDSGHELEHEITIPGPGDIDGTVDNLLEVTFKWATSNAANTNIIDTAILEILNPAGQF